MRRTKPKFKGAAANKPRRSSRIGTHANRIWRRMRALADPIQAGEIQGRAGESLPRTETTLVGAVRGFERESPVPEYVAREEDCILAGR